jgi:hypothetical protein
MKTAGQTEKRVEQILTLSMLRRFESVDMQGQRVRLNDLAIDRFWCNFSIEGRLSLFHLLLTRQALLPIPAGSRYRFCRIGSELGDEQADGQETANAMESAWRASLIAGSNRSPKRGFGGMLPRLVSRFPATAAEDGCMTPRNLTLSPPCRKNLWGVSGLAYAQNYGEFRDRPNALAREMPYIQRRYFRHRSCPPVLRLAGRLQQSGLVARLFFCAGIDP